MRLVTAPIRIGPGAWVAAGAFIGPGVTVGDGAVVGAGAVVMRDVEPWTVVAGNPAVFLAPPAER
jgi:putative colanic acid biosynthesis acetyltransferase WcaF